MAREMILIPKQKYLQLTHIEEERSPKMIENEVKPIELSPEKVDELLTVEHKPEIDESSNVMNEGKIIKRKLYKGPPGFMTLKRKCLKY
jgi:hypothetical protein